MDPPPIPKKKSPSLAGSPPATTESLSPPIPKRSPSLAGNPLPDEAVKPPPRPSLAASGGPVGAPLEDTEKPPIPKRSLAASGGPRENQEKPPIPKRSPSLSGTASICCWQTTQNKHAFIEHRFNVPTFCEFCESLIVGLLGKQGLKCSHCKIEIHKDCANKIPHDCILSDGTFKNVKPHNVTEMTFSKFTFCTICRNLLVGVSSQGFKCQTCSACVHENCVDIFQKSVACPPCFLDKEPVSTHYAHYWTNGNWSGPCVQCNSSVLSSSHMAPWKCFWCKAKLCSYSCLQDFTANQGHVICNGRPFRDITIPPTCLVSLGESDMLNWKISSRLPSSVSPVIVFLNTKSGGQLGNAAIGKLSRTLNPLQIFDLAKGGPKPGLKFMMNNPDINFSIIACGGDGTASWILSIMDELQTKNYPIAHCPLGTGNDLARACGWGPGVDNAKQALTEFLYFVSQGRAVPFDRWELSIQENGIDTKAQIGWKLQYLFFNIFYEYTTSHVVSKSMNNYFSIGVDAKIASNFHSLRSSNPKLFASQTINKMWYGKIGADAMLSGCPTLSKELVLNIDGVDIDLNQHGDYEAICVMNIPSVYAGAYLWLSDEEAKRAKLEPCSINDNLLEVVGLKSSFHLGNVQAGLASPIIMGQGKVIQFKISQTNFVQLDGEPWSQNPAIITISLLKQSSLLISKKAHPTILNRLTN